MKIYVLRLRLVGFANPTAISMSICNAKKRKADYKSLYPNAAGL